MTNVRFRPSRASAEVERALDFVRDYLPAALDTFRVSDERCQRDIILVLVEHDENARWLYEQLVANAPPVGHPPTLKSTSVQVMSARFDDVRELMIHGFGEHELDFPWEPDTARIMVVVDGGIHLTRRRLRYRDASTYSAEELREHATWMVRAARKQIRDWLGRLRLDETLAVIAVFHGADEKAMRLYRRVAPVVYDIPKDASTVTVIMLVDLQRAASLEGYEIDMAELAPVPGFLRIAVFTLGGMFVETMSKGTMEPGGDA